MAQRIYHYDGKKYYEVSVGRRDSNGGRIRKRKKTDENGYRINSKKVADRVERELRNEIQKEFKKPTVWTWKKWHKHYLETIKGKCKQSTIDLYCRNLKKLIPIYLDNRDIQKIKEDDIKNLISKHLKEKLKVSPNQQKRTLVSLRRIFQMAVEQNILQKNPVPKISFNSNENKKALSSTHFKYLLKEARQRKHPFYYHWAVTLHTGVRNGELYALTWG